jgi:hypothetical protein
LVAAASRRHAQILPSRGVEHGWSSSACALCRRASSRTEREEKLAGLVNPVGTYQPGGWRVW